MIFMFIEWVYHDTDDVTNDDFRTHSQEGRMSYTFSFTAPEKPTTEKPTSGSPAMYFPSIFGVLAILFLKYVIGA